MTRLILCAVATLLLYGCGTDTTTTTSVFYRDYSGARQPVVNNTTTNISTNSGNSSASTVTNTNSGNTTDNSVSNVGNTTIPRP